ncbi:hypothetical protein Sps_00328 [Shewanella psychrophila]|uniref:Lipase modulator n=1 Tax=Shewanella psychrophila TaxID=225848 RepID=A0A1S6HJ60_9GAMM|nr:hypothetical protein [Shewanella psychrophila]AQS35548.1 hypothetical protein Sps_00328 [Shewanella psychrophila]
MFNTKYIGILLIAALGGRAVYLFVEGGARQPLIPITSGLTPVDTRLRSTQVQGSAAAMSSERLSVKRRQLRGAIENSSGRELVALLTQFWRDCEVKVSCDQELFELKRYLSPERYVLLEHFLQNEQAREELLGLELVSQDISLEQKIAKIKYIDRQVWGDDAELVFKDEYALYQFTLKSRQLSELEDVSDFIDAYEQLLRVQHDDLASFALESEQAKYEHALTLIPDSYSAYDRESVIQALGERFLTPAQQTSIHNRQEQVTHQAAEVETYQQGLDALNRELMNSRQTDKSHLSPAQWEDYLAQRHYEYRLHFFAKN